jgi:hypothetical protein
LQQALLFGFDLPHDRGKIGFDNGFITQHHGGRLALT